MTAKRTTFGIILCAIALFCLCTLAGAEEGKKTTYKCGFPADRKKIFLKLGEPGRARHSFG